MVRQHIVSGSAYSCSRFIGMPPRKDEAALLADVATHRDWAVANLATLRGRDGQGLRAMLRQHAGTMERRI